MKPTITGPEALALRRKLKLNQQQFWSPIGVTQSGGSRYESGQNLPNPVQLLVLIAYGTTAQRARVLALLGTAQKLKVAA